jgi:hypothetical protein
MNKADNWVIGLLLVAIVIAFGLMISNSSQTESLLNMEYQLSAQDTEVIAMIEHLSSRMGNIELALQHHTPKVTECTHSALFLWVYAGIMCIIGAIIGFTAGAVMAASGQCSRCEECELHQQNLQGGGS